MRKNPSQEGWEPEQMILVCFHRYTVHCPLSTVHCPLNMLLLDGALGTELNRRGVDTALPLWSANALLTAPDALTAIHRDYILAGADVITADTFRTTRRTFSRAGLKDRSEELTAVAVDLAKKARAEFTEKTVLIAGSVGPLEDCYRPDLVPTDRELEEEHREHCQRLANAGVDMILCETIGTAREAYAIANAAIGTGVKTVISFLCREDGNLYSGEALDDAVRRILPLEPSAFSVNCLSARFMEKAIAHLLSSTDLPFAVYANVGMAGEELSDTFHQDVSPEEYVQHALRWQKLGAWMIGGCCGTTPEYIRMLKERMPKSPERVHPLL